ncbi:lysylphosphatidylglycerol synthase transmembrane domain-containing protein [soil metagenome]
MVIGTVLAVGCLYLVVRQIADGWDDYGDQIADARWAWLLVAVPLAVAGMSSLGLVWRSALATLGATVRRRDVFVWYQVGNLGKYIPGGVFQILGRGELATRGGVPRSVAYNSVALSMGATYLCGALVSAALLPLVFIEQESLGGTWWVFLAIPLGLAALHPRVLGRFFTLAEKLFAGAGEAQVPTWTNAVRLVLRHTVGWLGNGVACWAVAVTFAPDAPFATIVFAGIVSWVAGFLVIFVPSGLGVREATFTAIAATSLSPEIAATVAIVSRLVFVVADLIGAALALAVRASAASTPTVEPTSG